MSRVVWKTMKKKGGGTIRRKVCILASGKWKFLKGSGRKVRSKKSNPTRKGKRGKKGGNKLARRAKAKRVYRRARGFGLKTGIVGQIVRGLGGSYLTSRVTQMFAPGFSGIAGLVGAWYFGGWKGALGAEVIKMVSGEPTIISTFLPQFAYAQQGGGAV